MTTQAKQKIMEVLSDASLYLTVFAGLPYAFGDISAALPPAVKKWVTISSLTIAAASKFVQYAMQIIGATNPSSTPTPQPGAVQPTIQKQ